MRLSYSLLDPTGNITILVRTRVEAGIQPALAARLMELEPKAEQVGFLGTSEGFDADLRMAGGEFCGNASLSAAVLAASDRGMEEGSLALKVSGAPGPVRVKVSREGDGSWQGTVEMPRPLELREEALPGLGPCPLARFEGISHVILSEPMDHREAEALAPRVASFLKADAVGLLFIDLGAGTLAPLVYVPAARTLFWESSCASGTSAVGAYLASLSGKTEELALRQPGGTLSIKAQSSGGLFLSGRVRIEKEATADIALW